jgi:RES domain-containing protein
MSTIQPIVGIIMGSDSDLTIMQDAANILKQFNIPFELTVVSAHRTPIRMVEYATTAKQINTQSTKVASKLQKIGSDWIAGQQSLVLKVPSAVIPFEYNYIINTEHPKFLSKVKLVRTEAYFWDSRLL